MSSSSPTAVEDGGSGIAGTPNPRYAVILTALEVETRAVIRHLSDLREETVKGTVFHIGTFDGWEVAVAECGPGNVRAALIVQRAIDHFSPEVACFIGVAGGVKDVSIGDVVVATKVYAYERGKAHESAFEARPEVAISSYALDQRARAIRLKDVWRQRFNPKLSHPTSRIFVGPIAAGEKVVASKRSDIAKIIYENYGDTQAVEMEGYGFLDGVFISPPVLGCVVRGISDLLDKKEESDKAGSQTVAADAASAVAYEMLATLPISGTLPRLAASTMEAMQPKTEAAPATKNEVPKASRVLAPGQASTKSSAVYFDPGETLAEFGETADGDLIRYSYMTADGFYLRVIPGVPLPKQLDRIVLGSSIREAGLFALWRNPSGLFTQNQYGSIVVEPESVRGGALKALSQLFASGELWGLASWLLVRHRKDFGHFIPALALESVYRNVLARYINFVVRHLCVDPPVIVKAGAVGIQGFRLAVANDYMSDVFHDSQLEETYELRDFSQDSLNAILLRFFESMHAATGTPRPQNLYDFPSKAK
jgi:nucleoside phosphorylase